MKRRSTQAPPIPLSPYEYLIPLVHPSRSQLMSLREALASEEAFYVKPMGSVGKGVTGDYTLFAKLRDCPAGC